MIVLDTDHISVLQHVDSDAAARLRTRLLQAREPLMTTAISIEEQFRSWLGLIRRYHDARRQVVYYEHFLATLRFYMPWQVLQFDAAAAEEFQRLRASRVRIGAADLKIAAICLVHRMTLLSSNLRDFEQVAGLQVEDWLHTP